jgi:hypothetical protein
MQNFDRNIGFWEKRQFFAENRQKSHKIVIITSTTGLVSRQGVCKVFGQNSNAMQLCPLAAYAFCALHK